MAFIPTLLLVLPAAQSWFDHPEVLLPAGGEEFRAVADFDQDGAPDLISVAVPGTSPMFVRVRLNDGAGRFGEPITTTLAPAEQIPSPPAVGDFDEDGWPDIAVEVVPADGVHRLVWLRGLGTGGFGAPKVLADRAEGGAVAFEFDGDAGAELAVSVEFNFFMTRTAVYDWNGANLVLVDQGPGFSGPARPLVVADIDQDGDEDLFTVGDLTAHVVPNNGGALGALTTVDFGNWNWVIEEEQLGVAFADLDEDGDLDMIKGHSNWPDFTAEVRENVGGFQFVPWWTESFEVPGPGFVATGPASLRPVDWDSDGHLDLVGTAVFEEGFDSPSVPAVLLRGAGDGSLSPLWLPTLNSRATAGLADLDGNGDVELVMASTVAADDAAFNLATEVAGLIIFSENVWDHDLDGDVDVQLAENSAYPAATYAANDGTGALTEVPLFAPGGFGPGSFVQLPTCRGDFDGDGLPEFLGNQFDAFIFETTLLGLWRYELVPGLGYKSQGQAGPISEFVGWSPFAADANGDGHDDLIDGHTWWPGDGTGSFAAPVSAFPESILSVADVDGNGSPDFLVLTEGGLADDHLSLRVANGAGYDLVALHTEAYIHPWSTFLDLDGDGDPEVVAATSSLVNRNERVVVFENSGGAFSLNADLAAAAPDELRGFALDDVDGDGTADLLGLSGGTLALSHQRLFVFPIQTAPLSLDPGRQYLTWLGANLADADGDGDIDMLGSDTTRGLAVAPPHSGTMRQYGVGTSGTGGAVPLLGATGPLVPGATTSSTRMVGAVGGAPAFFTWGTEEVSLPLLETTLFVGGAVNFVPITLAGAPGVTGAGQFVLSGVNPASLAGLTLFLQVFVVDAEAPGFVCGSNGLEKTYGI